MPSIAPEAHGVGVPDPWHPADWQRRFHEHTCRDDDDLRRCVDDVHVNPLKHRLVDRVIDWPWSSFHRHVRLGEYSSEWGSRDAWYGDEFKNAE